MKSFFMWCHHRQEYMDESEYWITAAILMYIETVSSIAIVANWWSKMLLVLKIPLQLCRLKWLYNCLPVGSSINTYSIQIWNYNHIKKALYYTIQSLIATMHHVHVRLIPRPQLLDKLWEWPGNLEWGYHCISYLQPDWWWLLLVNIQGSL